MKRKVLNFLKGLKYSIGFYEMKCEDCEHWPDDYTPWGGFKPCQRDGNTDYFMVAGGDCNDAFYTKPDFCCRLWRLRK